MLSAVEALKGVVHDAPVDPAAAAHAAFAITAIPLVLADAVSALASLTYRPPAALHHEDLQRHQSASLPALALAKRLDTLAGDCATYTSCTSTRSSAAR